ncbi:hypothetical protein EK21DRAFT_91648 [Setomelanomma holmii]|uniref:Uncharacterized protein n=1 Tax=Setomelanomma holmii TaxID=210430 RepID=A0A9P4H5T8_9PLEO|nr:hypothetical protein EK21DRAFT_91648 [Setomelanomma holmii]
MNDSTSTSNNNIALENLGWSKEALFGLLGVLVVIIVPCVGLLIRLRITRCWKLRSAKDTDTIEDLEADQRISQGTSGGSGRNGEAEVERLFLCYNVNCLGRSLDHCTNREYRTLQLPSLLKCDF